jgi:nucleotide-binding universal stress UspA family protein
MIMPLIRTILHPTDFSPSSAKAFQLACELAQDSRARLVTLHVKPLPEVDAADVEYDFAIDDFEEPDSETFIEDVEDSEIRRDLRTFAPADPYLRIEKRVESGDPASEILRVVEEISADLIVMGTHGIAASDRSLLGSVACRVLTGAHCAIITVTRPPRTKNNRWHQRNDFAAAPLPCGDIPVWIDAHVA